MILKVGRVRRLRSGRLPFFGFGFKREGNRSRRRFQRMGKWETVFWFSSFPCAGSLGGGNVEISRCMRDFQGTVGRVEYRSEERRVGKECRSRWGRYHERKKRKK